ncbi:MAG: riboflavin biosynthesis protein RibD, partial [Spirochaetae bacterium HGW-Spirochaetae-6]
MISSNLDRRYMQLALTLSWAAKGTTSPNPTVGAVLVKDSQVIATGVTAPYGGFHAERRALDSLPLSQTTNATLYVTLEPCSHHGKTPPCTDIILEKKVGRVVVALLDPNPLVAGKGVSLLRAAGVQVDVGTLEEKARAINQDFFTWIIEKRPFITLKYAMTLDGK